MGQVGSVWTTAGFLLIFTCLTPVWIPEQLSFCFPDISRKDYTKMMEEANPKVSLKASICSTAKYQRFCHQLTVFKADNSENWPKLSAGKELCYHLLHTYWFIKKLHTANSFSRTEQYSCSLPMAFLFTIFMPFTTGFSQSWFCSFFKHLKLGNLNKHEQHLQQTCVLLWLLWAHTGQQPCCIHTSQCPEHFTNQFLSICERLCIVTYAYIANSTAYCASSID